MKNDNTKYLPIGAILCIVGLFIFFHNTRIASVGFYYIGSISTGGILIALIMLTIMLMSFINKPYMKYILFGLIGGLLLSVILGTRLYFHGTLLDMILIILPIAIGCGLLLKYFTTKKKQ